MEQKTYSSKQAIRRQLYERDKLLSAIEPYGATLYSCLIEMVAIAEKYERRDGILDAKQVLKNVEKAIQEKMEWNEM